MAHDRRRSRGHHPSQGHAIWLLLLFAVVAVIALALAGRKAPSRDET